MPQSDRTQQPSDSDAAGRAVRERTEADAVARIVRDHIKPEIVKVNGQDDNPETEILILPDGQGGLKAHGVKPYLDPYRRRPERRVGTAKLTDLDSLIGHVNRFKDGGSALFAIDDREAPAMVAVLNYHPEGAESDPRFGDHKARYDFPLSDEWKAWRGVDGETLEQIDFAEFLEDRIVDVMAPPNFLTARADPNATDTPEPDVDPGGVAQSADRRLFDLVTKIGGKVCGPARLMELAKGLKIHDQQTVKEIVSTTTGEAQLQFETAHRDSEGKPIQVPNLFLLAIPVFHNGPLYRVPVRLRYRLRAGRISWGLNLHRPDIVQDHAFDEACDRAAEETACPLFFGQPEA